MPNAFLGLIESACHGGAVANVGFDGERAASRRFDLPAQFLQPPGAARHQRDAGAVGGKHLRETPAKPAGGAGHQRHFVR